MSISDNDDGGAVTAVFFPGKTDFITLRDAVRALASHIKVTVVDATAPTCDVCHIIKVPALLVYNKAGEETARAYGDKHIVDLISSIAE